MSISELLPAVHSLPDPDKLHLIRILAENLTGSRPSPLEHVTGSLPVWTPRHAQELRYLVPVRLIYRCGLRVSECVQVKVRDLDRAAGRLQVREGKGGKDRQVPVPAVALEDLTAWWRQHRLPTYLFPGMGHGWRATRRRQPEQQAQVPGAKLQSATYPMSASALQTVWRRARAACGVPKPATIHTLRHSYATHLWEAGVSLRYVSQYLGHVALEQTLAMRR